MQVPSAAVSLCQRRTMQRRRMTGVAYARVSGRTPIAPRIRCTCSLHYIVVVIIVTAYRARMIWISRLIPAL